MITNERIIAEAKIIGCEPAAIKAVDMVESGGAGFLPTGEPTILFEPHIFWKQLKKVGIDPNGYTTLDHKYANVLYPVWGTKPYGKPSEQHARLQLACTINKAAALQSASWGRYQIMGFNWKECGCANLQEFINKVCKDEDSHLDLFVHYILSVGLEDELIHKDFDGFARGYNGPQWQKNDYGNKLRANYQKAKLIFAN